MLNSFLRLSQRVVGKASRELGRMADLIPAKPSFTAEQRRALQRNRIFLDQHKGRRCFVIATGPSLKTQNIEPLANEITFVMGGFWHHEVLAKWQPTYYCISDPFMFNGSAPVKEFFDSMRKRITGSKFFVPLQGREIVEKQSLLPLDQTYWIAFRGGLYDRYAERRNIDLTADIPGPMSVSQLCIMAAIYMGCSPIYLLGVDHDWLAHRGEDGHFYQGHGGLENHPEFTPVLAHRSYKYLMDCQLKLWLGYETLKQMAAAKEIQILNATNGGFLDVFERANFDDVVKSQ